MKRILATLAAAALLGAVFPPPAAAGQSSRSMYMNALARERGLRDARNTPTLEQLRAAVAEYERLARKYPGSGYSDNALWQGGNLSLLAYQRFGQAPDRRNASRLLAELKSRYPHSSLVSRVDAVLAEADSTQAPEKPAAIEQSSAAPAPADKPTPATRTPPASGSLVTIKAIKRTPLADGMRITVEMDAEALYHHERVPNPERVFFDLRGTRTAPSLQDATMKFEDEDVVREIRLGRHPQNTTRIVMDMRGVESYSVFTLYNPFRLVVDFRRPGVVVAPPAQAGLPPAVPSPAAPAAADAPRDTPVPAPGREAAPAPAASTPSRVQPAVPAANSNGQFSLARQLGLGISRIVIDAGHGGHDPGAQSNGVVESELVLDVALRVRKLLEQQPGIEVCMTRDTDVFVPLEERTAIANREAADLFLSIHANASRNPRARGIETYFLNFATNPEAEAVAARENSASGRTMHSLPDILKAIALNNKIDESRDFAATVQRSMVKRLTARNKQLKDLGVKQAPFVVLIGAGMPSVLAEISFVTNRQEGQLLKTAAYRQRIAEALFDAVVGYQRSLKKMNTVATTGQR